MTEPASKLDSASAAENLRLALALMGKHAVPPTPVNYALMYFHVSGEDLDLSEKIEELLESRKGWNDTAARELFDCHVCQGDGKSNEALREELLATVANILGMLIDLSGRTAVSNDKLEQHIDKLAHSKDPQEVLSVASDIISETRNMVDQARQFESTLLDTTQEIEQLKDELFNARRQATMDALTGLNNRRGFDQALQDAIGASNDGEGGFCLLMIDIDHFKNINDTHGHLVGDKVLVGVAKMLHKFMRGNDFLARYGGEEFAVLLRDTPITGAFSVAENLRKGIEKLRLKHLKTGQQIGQVTISIGVACHRQDENADDLVGRCDKALYRAKNLGRNRTVLAD